MANPNIASVSAIYGKTVGAALTTTLTTSLLANSASSGKIYKVNTILVSNVDGTNDQSVTLELYDGSTAYKLVKGLVVPATTTLTALDKDTVLYLEEGWSIRGGAGADSDLEILISYEDIS